MASAVLQNLAICGPLEGANRIGTCGEPGEGAYVRIWLIVRDDRVERASYATHGCPSCAAASGMAVTLAMRRKVEEALRIEAKDIDTVLGGLPEGKGHFADMAAVALKRALENEG